MHICLLDIDGTLVLTGGAGQTAFSQTLTNDFAITEINTHVPFAGRSDRAIVADLFSHHGVEASDANWRRFCEGYLSRLDAALVSHQGHVLPGVAKLLAELADRGDVAIGLVTGNVREGARRKLQHFDLWNWFPFGGFGDEHVDRCDIAAAALTAAHSHLSITANGKIKANGSNSDHAVVVIGDTIHDIRCARSIGALCVAVATGQSTAAELQTGAPDVILNNLIDVRPILELFD
jgi:phosphoglycolate phosphatase